VDLQRLPVNSGRAFKNMDAKKKTKETYNFKPKTSLLKMFNVSWQIYRKWPKCR
jgi:hypothetical protein